MDNFSKKFNDFIGTIGENLIIFVLVLVAGLLAVKFIMMFSKKAILKTKLDHTVKTFLYSMLRVLLYAIVVVTALSTIGVNVNSIVTALGAAAVTAGLALQDTIKNFVSGIIIIFSKPFTAGDLIEFEGIEGYVESIRVFYTTITTYENKSVKIPNSKLTSNNVTNCSSGEYRRVSLKYTVSYEDQITKVKTLTAEWKSQCLYGDIPTTISLYTFTCRSRSSLRLTKTESQFRIRTLNYMIKKLINKKILHIIMVSVFDAIFIL